MAMVSMHNKVIWITGASSGIGAGLAQRLAAEQSLLILSGRQQAALEQVAEQCRAAGAQQVLCLPFEATDFAALAEIVKRAQQWQGRIDLLINNAGISQRSQVLDTELETYRHIMEVDYFAPVALTKLVLPIMLAQGGGMIAVTSSLAGKLGSKLRSGYCSAKHALHGFFDSLDAELHAQNIRVCMILPGYVQSQVSVNALLGDGARQNSMDAGQASAISALAAADIIVKGLQQQRSEIYVGTGREMLAPWLKRFFPKRFRQIIRNQALPQTKAV